MSKLRLTFGGFGKSLRGLETFQSHWCPYTQL